MVANQREILAIVKDTEDLDGSQAEVARDASLTRSQSISKRNIDKFLLQNKHYLIALYLRTDDAWHSPCVSQISFKVKD